ncbi:MAG: hypothetical protein DCC68_15760 [Planctomycetota bacterium]|nr:MAG: hypothetical protein DCC68_15760 [Planctomycetota bacterium]
MTAQILQDVDEKASYREAVQAVREKCSILDASSPIKIPLEKAIRTAVTRLETLPANGLGWGGWRPPLLALVDVFTPDELLTFDADCRRIAEQSAGTAWGWLDEDSPDKWNEWHGQLFDLSLKARLLDECPTVDLDKKVASGRDVDISVDLSTRPVRIEATAHCESREQQGIERRWMDKKKSRPDLVLVQPGPFDPTDAAGNSIAREPLPAYSCIRVYLKVYEKVAKNLNPNATQFDGTVPTILAINLPRGGNRARRGAEMAIEELFSKWRNSSHRNKKNATSTDIDDALVGWLDHRATELVRQNQLQWDRYLQSRTQLLMAPAKISAIVVFERYDFSFARMNYNALPSCMLTHAEMAELDELLATPPPTWTRRMTIGPE